MLKYVSLGDSIAYGMSSDPDKGFSDLYSAYLKSQTDHGYTFVNTAVPGWKTRDLYNAITRSNESSNEALTAADIVTISIGSNNLLGPVIGAIPNAVKIMPDRHGWRKKLIDLFMATHFSQTFLNRMMDRGIMEFHREWPMILSKIREKAPSSSISVLTLYNALKTDHPYYHYFDPYVVKVNGFIRSQADLFAYDVVDVYTSFQNSVLAPIDFNYEEDVLDPHPNNWGHQLIFNNLIPSSITKAP